ncbi:MAG: hypothetical protein LBQ67_02080 [Treponema sp.]|jgi:hypothetical protein|nr:hypothetical protein [Treponema sp.]
MFDPKISGIAAGAAFIISFLLGLLRGVSFPALMLRPLIFAVLFFIIAYVVCFLVTRFLPELLDTNSPDTAGAEDIPNPGLRIDITEEEPQEAAVYAVPTDDSENNLGNISDLFGETRAAETGSPGLDQNKENGYNSSGNVSVDVRRGGNFTGGGKVMPKTVLVSDAAESVDVLPDLDSMARAFLPNSGEEDKDAAGYPTATFSVKRPAVDGKSQNGKSQGIEGDFDPKELAAGIRTILKKEG